jgi:hypothetical protein
MKKVLLTLLAVIVVLGLFAASGYSGYRFGYARGMRTTANNDSTRPEIRPFDQPGLRRMPMHHFDERPGRDIKRGFGHGDFPMRRFGFFSPLMFLLPIVVLALIAWLAYWLFTRNGWQLTRRTQTLEPQASSAEEETEAEG